MRNSIILIFGQASLTRSASMQQRIFIDMYAVIF